MRYFNFYTYQKMTSCWKRRGPLTEKWGFWRTAAASPPQTLRLGCRKLFVATFRWLFTMQIKFTVDLPQTIAIHINLMVNFWRSSPQVYGKLNLHGKKSPKGCRRFTITSPETHHSPSCNMCNVLHNWLQCKYHWYVFTRLSKLNAPHYVWYFL